MEPSANQIPGFIVFVFSVFQNPVYRTALRTAVPEGTGSVPEGC